jgi:hypothetical protein
MRTKIILTLAWLTLAGFSLGYHASRPVSVNCSDVSGLVEYCHVVTTEWGWPLVYFHSTTSFYGGDDAPLYRVVDKLHVGALAVIVLGVTVAIWWRPRFGRRGR